jgi:hypothetical protein
MSDYIRSLRVITIFGSFRIARVSVGNTGVQLTVGRYGVLVDVGCGLGS